MQTLKMRVPRKLRLAAAAAAAGVVVIAVGTLGARATTVSVSPDDEFLKRATHVALARIASAKTTHPKCVIRQDLVLSLEDAVRGPLPTRKPVEYHLADYPYEEGCPGISYARPPRASTLTKGARIVVALDCRGRDACVPLASWNEDARAEVEKKLAVLGRADPHDAACIRVADKRIEEAITELGKPAATPSGVRATLSDSGHKIHGPAFLAVTLEARGKKGGGRALSDAWSAWRRDAATGLCWRVLEAEDFDPQVATIQLFELPAAP